VIFSALFVDGRRRRFLDDLLMPARSEHSALAEMDAVAVLVRENLHLDVSRTVDEPLEKHAAVAERGGRLTPPAASAAASSLASRTTRMPLPPRRRGFDEER